MASWFLRKGLWLLLVLNGPGKSSEITYLNKLAHAVAAGWVLGYVVDPHVPRIFHYSMLALFLGIAIIDYLRRRLIR